MQERLAGIMLGTAVGDALGLPAEGMTPSRRRRIWPGPWRYRFFFGRGMTSDDTEHTFFVAQSLLREPKDAEAFQRRLAKKLRWWLAGLPAGVGLATLRACLKLWIGFPPQHSGVWSAGNGPAMRSALIGGYFCEDENAAMLADFVKASTTLTHTDPRALTAAMAVARLAAWAVRHGPSQPPEIGALIETLAGLAPDDAEWRDLVEKIRVAHKGKMTVTTFAVSLGLEKGVTGYAYHTVPVAIYAWLLHYGDFRATVEAVLECGGDTDTSGAIAGALAGATTGPKKIPGQWLVGIIEWPRSMKLLTEAAYRLAYQKRDGRPLGPVSYFWPGVLVRNLFFMAIVLLHGLRRLLPPYS
jgi:ADP-ribosyl-[dinitrogen reductase] hydrolase